MQIDIHNLFQPEVVPGLCIAENGGCIFIRLVYFVNRIFYLLQVLNISSEIGYSYIVWQEVIDNNVTVKYLT